MWSLIWTLSTSPSVAAGGAIQVAFFSSEEDPWAVEQARRTAQKRHRQWRRASRRSEAPIPEPLPEDPPELPIPGVTLDLVDATGERLDAEIRQTCITNDQGMCTFSALTPGMWKIVASSVGFRGMTISQILVVEGETTFLRLRLVPYEPEYIMAPRRTRSGS